MRVSAKWAVFQTTLFLMLATTATGARAGLITFTEAVKGSGTLDGDTFADRSITIKYVGDTANITIVGGVSVLTGGVATVTVAGIGTDTFSAADRMQVYADSNTSPTASAGIRDGSAMGIVLATYSSDLGGYQLTAPYGPVIGDAYFGPGIAAATSGGSFEITATSGQSTFTALPEPASLFMTGLGAVGLVATGLARRRIAARAR